MTIGVIADDFTGATDVAVALRRAGLRTAIVFDLPGLTAEVPSCDAIVVGLKTRTIAPADAVARSLAAAEWLRRQARTRLFFKFCSTFDSRPEGNIGPVADALADLVGAEITVVVPSSPEHHRTQYLGQLFVHDQLLSESPMRHHPLTPMTDSNVVRLLQAQTERPVVLVPLPTVRSGADAVRAALDEARAGGARYAVVDALTDQDLRWIGEATKGDELLTGAAGLAAGLGSALAPETGGEGLRLQPHESAHGPSTAVLAGSCSARTLQQIERMTAVHDGHFLDAVTIPDSARLAEQALAWFEARGGAGAPLFYSSVPPGGLQEIQAVLGADRASDILETALGLIATGLVERGVQRLIVAGGETSGAVVTALGVTAALIGEEEAPGVPWIHTLGEDPVALLLKSGNFGDPDLLLRAARSREQVPA